MSHSALEHSAGGWSLPDLGVRPSVWVFAGTSASVCLGWLALRSMDWSGTGHAFLHAGSPGIALAFAAITLSTLLQALRWKVLLPGENVSCARLFLVRSAGQSVNQLLPLRVAGEAAELAMLTQRDDVHGGKVAASIFLGRSLDLVVTTTMMCVGFFLMPQLSSYKALIVPSIALAAGTASLFLFSRRLSQASLVQRIRPVHAFVDSLASWQGRPRLIAAALVTAAAWVALGTGAWLIARTLGIALPLWTMATLLVMMTSLTSVVPGGPGSLGVFEFAGISILGLFTVEQSSALTFALIIHALIFLPPLAIGVPVLARERRTWRGTKEVLGRLTPQAAPAGRRLAAAGDR